MALCFLTASKRWRLLTDGTPIICYRHDSHSDLPFDEKLLKLLNHWIKHNEDHALNYRNWVEKAKAKGKDETGLPIEEAAEMSLAINEKFEAALATKIMPIA
jgi:hypothetical protein